MYLGRFIAGLTNFIIALTEIVLSLRFVFRLFDANTATPFVSWVYDTSQTLLDPFRGIFPNSVIDPGNVLEFSTLFAIILYGLIGYLVLELMAWLDASNPVQAVHTERHA